MANAIAISSVPNPTTNVATVSFSSDVLPIFRASCAVSGCHTGSASGASGLSLDDGVAHANIVNQQNVFQSGTLIAPENPDTSYLFLKLQERNPPDVDYFGGRMPRGRSPLTDAEMTLIRTWIEEGALDN